MGASAALAQIIPPSLVLIVMADQLGKSVGDMYQGAFIPGLTLAALYAVYVAIVTMVRPDAAPALPPDAIMVRDRNGRVGYASLGAVVSAAVAAAYVLSYSLHVIWACPLSGPA